MKVVNLIYLKLQFEYLSIEHIVVIGDNISYKFILGNDFLFQYCCGILNTPSVIVFGNKSVTYTLFRSTINSICPVIFQSRTEIEPYEKTVILELLDFYRQYDPDQTLLFDPRRKELMQPLITEQVIVNFTSAVVAILVLNISAERETIRLSKVIADGIEFKVRHVDVKELSSLPNCVALVSTTDARSAPSPDLVSKAMKNADKSLVFEQRVILERCSANTTVNLQLVRQTWGHQLYVPPN